MTAAPADLLIDRPAVSDGAALWRLAKDSKTLDLNSSYSYLLWCRDFAGTSVVARGADGEAVGFVTGYLRPDRPGTLLIWQVAVDAAHRGHGIAAALLDALTERLADEHGITDVETTITPGNTASERLFTSFAARHHARLTREVLFPTDLFPDGPHDPEVLYRIGPLNPSTSH
ncbi:diaminobutyrate acetyltransferase [Streptomyces pluripotens]|uniref:L-2,4-diaminobutyric acid acetyltransferase n=1 Tax=Streptomyces pluripotens TaxID=1355015 RepID=A0A221NVB2_9ACTN|nr:MULTISPECIES: diaminobutyrate acetyltransferase [Streptomyces]ARP69623.1 diaminobutyrate acetyltransferase [Streptomyces pluripotens]ASN23880.1 diaminobutyrate acetyltransferase [Streptomyces pluripotens]KIE24548.1 L-2,4-diaminobutyric acid acetyltransferase [Streptomyces sp. MUSC 125]MCH0558620.1 diaminobutyrate acetyltransferase [Streptomyces sp. MUM 16J]